MVMDAVIGLDGGDDHGNDPKNEQHKQQNVPHHKYHEKQTGNGINGDAHLKTERFFALPVDERRFTALEQPDDDRRKNMTDERKEKKGERGQMTTRRPKTFIRREIDIGFKQVFHTASLFCRGDKDGVVSTLE